MINISEEIKSFVDEVEFFGGKFDPFFVDEDNTITFKASHKELKKYEEIVYNTFLPFYANKYLFKINKED